MIKVMLLVRRRDGMSRDEFRAYYETTHAPLASSLMQHCTRYVRNFVEEEPTGPQDFDVITEFWFDSEQTWEVAVAGVVDETTQQRLAEDEGRFMDRATMRAVRVRECETDPSQLLGNPAA